MNRERKKVLYSAILSASPHSQPKKKLPCDFNLLKRKDSPQGNPHKFDTLSLSLALFPYQLSELQHKCTHTKENFNSLIDTCEKKTKARARTGIKYVSYQTTTTTNTEHFSWPNVKKRTEK